ncbi:MAG: hypothetical protein IKR04_03775 [Clostridia bacterium]|nr:hypothetical protein [Clostridia bacterium]
MKKAIIVIVILLIIAGIVAAVILSRGKQPAKPESGEVVTSGEEFVEVPKKEQTGTAGSNIPLKDNYNEIEMGVRSAIFNLVSEEYGDKVFDVRTNVTKAYDYEAEQEVPAVAEMNLGADEVAVEFEYDIKPSADATSGDILLMSIANGEYDEESGWIKKYGLGVLKVNESGDYIIDNLGTGW